MFLFVLVGNITYAEIQVDCQFPGGNILVDSIDAEKNTVHIRPDLRDTMGSWFYFAFRVRDAEGKTVRFEFEPNSHCLGPLGPAGSSDEGATWGFLSDKKIPDKPSFTYTFGPNEKSVLFAHAIPYTQKNWDIFIAKYRDRNDIRLETLCKSHTGKRDVEQLRISPNNPNAKFWMAFTARHHAGEVSANHMVEGILQEIFSDSKEGKWLRENTEIVVIPFMDKDGVEEGDQGKNRKPHDHNRDYIQEIYPSVKAFKNTAGRIQGKGIRVHGHARSVHPGTRTRTSFLPRSGRRKAESTLESFSWTAGKEPIGRSDYLRWQVGYSCGHRIQPVEEFRRGRNVAFLDALDFDASESLLWILHGIRLRSVRWRGDEFRKRSGVGSKCRQNMGTVLAGSAESEKVRRTRVLPCVKCER